MPPRRTGSRSRSLQLIRQRRLSHSFLAMNRLKPTRAVTPLHVAPKNRCFRVSSMNLDRKGGGSLQTRPSEPNRYSLRVRLSRYSSIHLANLTCTDAWASMHGIFSIASIHCCSHRHLSHVYLAQDDVSVLLGFLAGLTSQIATMSGISASFNEVFVMFVVVFFDFLSQFCVLSLLSTYSPLCLM